MTRCIANYQDCDGNLIHITLGEKVLHRPSGLKAFVTRIYCEEREVARIDDVPIPHGDDWQHLVRHKARELATGRADAEDAELALRRLVEEVVVLDMVAQACGNYAEE